MPRQQRTSTPRRSLNPATRPSYNSVVWVPISIVGADCTFQLSQDSASLVRTGIPQVFAGSIASMPSSVVWSGATMVLTYPSALSVVESFTVEPGSPEVRSFSGGYLAPVTLTFGTPSPPPAGTIFAPYCSGLDLRGAVADGFGGTSDQLVSAFSSSCGFSVAAMPLAWMPSLGSPAGWINVNVGDLSPQIYCTNPAGFRNLTTGDFGQNSIDGASLLKIQFPNPVSLGDMISFPTGVSDVHNDWGQTLWVANVVIWT